MMNKKARKSDMEVTHAHNCSYAIGDNKARLKYEGLLQDYHELRKETQAKKKKLQKINKKKLQLSNEVRFLSKRYQELLKNPSQQNKCILIKKQSLAYSYDTKPIENPSTSIESQFDLNQNQEEIDERIMQKAKVENENCSKKERVFVCRDLGTGTGMSRTGKRKITWEDQVTLRV